MKAYEVAGRWLGWSGEDIGSAELIDVVVPEIPEGKIRVGAKIEMVDGVLTLVQTLADPETYMVSRRQFMVGLYVWDLLDTANQAVTAAGGITQLAWNETTDFYIDDPMLVALVKQIGMEDRLQEFFNFCATL